MGLVALCFEGNVVQFPVIVVILTVNLRRWWFVFWDTVVKRARSFGVIDCRVDVVHAVVVGS